MTRQRTATASVTPDRAVRGARPEAERARRAAVGPAARAAAPEAMVRIGAGARPPRMAGGPPADTAAIGAATIVIGPAAGVIVAAPRTRGSRGDAPRANGPRRTEALGVSGPGDVPTAVTATGSGGHRVGIREPRRSAGVTMLVGRIAAAVPAGVMPALVVRAAGRRGAGATRAMIGEATTAGDPRRGATGAGTTAGRAASGVAPASTAPDSVIGRPVARTDDARKVPIPAATGGPAAVNVPAGVAATTAASTSAPPAGPIATVPRPRGAAGMPRRNANRTCPVLGSHARTMNLRPPRTWICVSCPAVSALSCAH